MENENFAHMEPSKEMLGLQNLENTKHWNEPTEPYNWGDKLSEEKMEEVIREYIPEEKAKVATGRRAGKDNKTPLESLKVHHHKIKLQEKMDTSKIIHEQKNTNHAMYCNTAVVYLNPGGKHFLEEAYLQEGLRKIQGFRK